MAKLMRYILLPRQGFSERGFLAESPRAVTRDIHSAPRSTSAETRAPKIIHSIKEDGPKLAEMDEVIAREMLSRTQMRAMPVLNYPSFSYASGMMHTWRLMVRHHPPPVICLVLLIFFQR